MNPFGQYIREKRQKKNMTLKELGQHLDLSAVYIGEVERGERKPFLRKHWKTLCEVLDLHEEDLFIRAVFQRPLTLDVRNEPVYSKRLTAALFVQKFHELTPLQIAKLLDILT